MGFDYVKFTEAVALVYNQHDPHSKTKSKMDACKECGMNYVLFYDNYGEVLPLYCPNCGHKAGKTPCDSCEEMVDILEDDYAWQDDLATKYLWCAKCLPEVIKARAEMNGLEIKGNMQLTLDIKGKPTPPPGVF